MRHQKKAEIEEQLKKKEKEQLIEEIAKLLAESYRKMLSLKIKEGIRKAKAKKQEMK